MVSEEKADFFTIQVKGEEGEGYYVVITEGPFDNYEDAQRYASVIVEDIRKDDPSVGNLTWH
jgi:hypothetical protein